MTPGEVYDRVNDALQRAQARERVDLGSFIPYEEDASVPFAEIRMDWERPAIRLHPDTLQAMFEHLEGEYARIREELAPPVVEVSEP